MKQSRDEMPVHSRVRGSRRLVIPIAMLLLVSLACSVPSLSRSTPAVKPTPAGLATLPLAQTAGPTTGVLSQPAVQAASPTPAQKLPPALIEVQPQPQSSLTSGTEPVFYFNQPMQKSSVESAFKTQPDLGGKFEWLDDATLRFVPSKPLAAGTSWQMTINTGAKAANGLALATPVQVSYPAAAPLRIAERLPASKSIEVNPTSAVAVTFTRPVVALGADAQSLPPAFTLDPTVQGRGEWVNTSTYIFYPQPALNGGAKYTVHFAASLTSLDGVQLDPSDASTPWSFSTAAPQVVTIAPASEQPVQLDSEFTLTFNQPMETDSVEAGFSLTPPSGGPVQGKFTWNSLQTALTFKPKDLLQRGVAYTLSLPGSVRSLGGAALGKDYAAVLTTVPQFTVTQTQPAAGMPFNTFSGYGTLTLTLSSPLASAQDYTQLITIKPSPVDLVVVRDAQNLQLYISGFFQPSTSYTLTLSADLQDRWGAKLGTPFSFTFSTQPATPSLVIPVQMQSAGALFVPSSETSIPAMSTNINRVTITRGQLGLQEFLQAASGISGVENWSTKAQETWMQELNPKPDATQTVNLNLAKDGSALAPGLYFLKLESQPVPSNNDSNSPPMLVTVSPIQMVFKTSTRQAFVWAVKVPENTPLPNAAVTILDANAQSVGSCTTDASGTCQVDLPHHDEPYKGLFAVHGQPGDADFSLAADNWSGGVTPWNFNQVYEYEGYQPQVYLYTDRPIYRPGQTLNFRLIARDKANGRYASALLKTLTVDVVSPYDPISNNSQTLTTLQLSLDSYGSASGMYTIPTDARPGSYNLRVKEVEYTATSFEVAEYRKPEIDLQVKFSQTDLLAGKDIQSQVTARYFFGAPAGNLALHWTLMRTPGYLDLPDGLSSGLVDTSWLSFWAFPGGGDQFVIDGNAQTSPDGTATITITGQDLLDRIGTDAQNLQSLKLQVVISDESGLPVSAQASAKLHPAPYAIGVRSEQWNGQAGQAMTYTVRTVDWQGNPVADKPLSAHFRKVVWMQSQEQDPSMPSSLRPQYTDAGSTDFRTSAQGEARLAFTPANPGTYMIEITGQEGAVTQSLAWVGGAGTVVWPDLDNQRIYLRSDAKSYQAGQTAHIFIPNPYPEGALALVTVERAKVMRSMVIPIQGPSYDLQLPLSEDDAPNIYAVVTLLGRSNQRPDFRMGMLNLDVAPTAELLQVSVASSPPQPQPGGDVTLNLRVKDSLGKPVQGEFSLALIDKAVLALADPNAPAIDQAFYGRQPLGVQNSLSLAIYAGRFIVSPPGRGGGGGGAPGTLPLRSQFADTAYWNGAITTDVTGVAQVTVKLPDNLTTWQADVRGLSADSRVGQGSADLITTRPLLIRPVAPRFVVLGDHIQLAAVVNNNTQAGVTASARLEVAGFTLDDPNLAVQSINVPAAGQTQVSWWGTVQDVPALDLTFSVEVAGQPALSDAARPELNPVPVLHYRATQTFGTSGVLSEAGKTTELVSLPRSFTPLGGSLNVELSPSLSAAVLEGLKVLDAYPQDFTEPVLSRLLPNLAAAQAFKDLKIEDDTRRKDLETAINDSVVRLIRLQNQDGGWGWSSGASSESYISSYALLGLTRAAQAGVFVDPQVLNKAQNYLVTQMILPTTSSQSWEVDRLAFAAFALKQSGRSDVNLDPLYEFREKLSPWGKAFLALALQGQTAGDTRARTLVSDLESSAARSSTGASWQDTSPAWRNWSTPNFTTAVVAYAIARLDPASSVLIDAVRYLTLNRQPSGAWTSSYESAWSLMALTEAMRATGDSQASYAFSARLNDSPLIDGSVATLAQAAKSVDGQVPLAKLIAGAPNALVIQRAAGSGRLYYRAFLQVDRSAQDAPAVDRGMALTRQYYRAGQDCRKQTCQPLDGLSVADAQPVQVRLTLTVPQDLYYVVVEDYFPAGAEVLNPRLKTSQQVVAPAPDQAAAQNTTPYDLSNPFDQGWGWWLFNDPQVYADHVRWVVNYLPAGTYELTYRLTPFLAGEYRVLPAHAWEYYFPDVEGSSKGQVVNIK